MATIYAGTTINRDGTRTRHYRDILEALPPEARDRIRVEFEPTQCGEIAKVIVHAEGDGWRISWHVAGERYETAGVQSRDGR